MRQILELSGSATLQNLIGMASWIGLVRILAGFGSDALAGYTIAVRLIIFALLPSWGLSNAAATMVGQSLGARKPDRAEASVWRAGRYNAVLPHRRSGLLFFVGRAAHPPGVHVGPGGDRLRRRTASASSRSAIPLYAYGMVLTQSFNGAGDTWTPTWLNLVVLLGVRDPVRLGARAPGRPRAAGRLLGDHGRVLDAGARERGGVQARAGGRRGWCREPGTGTRAELERPADPYTGRWMWACTKLTDFDPSPTADATRFTEPLRTSPAANTPGRLVSSRNGSRPASRQRSAWRVVGGSDGPVRTKPLAVELDAASEPLGVGVGADEEEERAGPDRHLLPRPVARAHLAQMAVAIERGDPRCRDGW